ncbi:uncharacterized protein TNCV_880551 [Trichonephila clavipes]|nr:uncharacterized protein TNCV_880551 [Trichonephila clavipes]
MNFPLTLNVHEKKPRAISTCWSAFRNILNNDIDLSDYKITSKFSLEENIAKFTDAVRFAHRFSSQPIKNKHHSYTPQHIKELIRHKNRPRKQFQLTLNPLHKAEANRLQALIKKELQIHTEFTWSTKLTALDTQDNSLWRMQKNFRKPRSAIPNLNCSSGIASNDEQKANLIANSFDDNYTKNKRPENFRASIDSDVNTTLETFFASPPPPRLLLLTQ